MSWKAGCYYPASLRLRYWHILELCVAVCFGLYFRQGLLFCSLGWPGIHCLAQSTLSCMVIPVSWSPSSQAWATRSSWHSSVQTSFCSLHFRSLHLYQGITVFCTEIKWLLSFCRWEFFQLSMLCLFSLSGTRRCSCLLSTLFILFRIFSVLGNQGSFCWVTQLECNCIRESRPPQMLERGCVWMLSHVYTHNYKHFCDLLGLYWGEHKLILLSQSLISTT